MVEEKELYCGTSSKNYIAACSSSLHALTGFDFSREAWSDSPEGEESGFADYR